MSPTADEHELRAWIRLGLEPGLGAARIRDLLAVFGMPQDIYAASTGSLARHLDPGLATSMRQAPDQATQTAIDKALDWLHQPGHRLLTLADPEYPAALLALHDPPPMLYLNGRPDLLQRPAIAVVGARSATVGGMDNARAFARHLAQQGWCIVSGLASGIDAAAHEGALEAGPDAGGTIAVLGTGIDIVYPARNRALAHRTAQHGLLVSEFPLGARALPFFFPMRNRIVAALSRGVLVVEAARQSGSLITARLASELGREVFAIPGSIHSPLSRGCHALIRQGAKLVESSEDILEELRQSGFGRPLGSDNAPRAPTPATPAPPPGSDADILLRALGHDPASVDALLTRTGWDIARLNGQLGMLEVSGLIERLADGRFARAGA
ncbi:DNA-processing protein DprA [Castellaniella sp. GW247-6E4]|uniref:DNA-processing protein DprA n=1 Tax=Castellaniella sp. GW247-6E4 TaxID=3140380 RepID=UPI003314FBAA